MRGSRDLVYSMWGEFCFIFFFLSFSGLVDLPKESFEAAYSAITLPEEFHDFDTQTMK